MIDLIYNIATKIPIPDIELTFEGIVTLLFNICCGIIYLLGEATGIGYELMNLLIFVVLHPLITLTFFMLWRNSKHKQQKYKELAKYHYSNKN
jgi:amino acid transporter